MSKAPAVSVVLPVYNCARYVGEAIESVLAQTYRDFELIVVDDGSTDETPRVLSRFAHHPSVRLLGQGNSGLAVTLNRGIELARGRYIARQDHDDLCHPRRFEMQVAYLEQHPRCGLIGTWAEIWRHDRPTGRQHRHPSQHAALKYELLLNNPFVHSSVMIRKDALDRVGGYSADPKRQPPEDYELWSRLAREYEVANVPKVLHIYRELAGSMSRDGESPFVERLIAISAENIAHAAGVEPSHPHVINIAALVHGAPHKLQGEVNLRAMTEIFRRAAQAVVPEDKRARFARKAELEMRALRYRYPQIFGTGLLSRKAAAFARRTLAVLKGLH